MSDDMTLRERRDHLLSQIADAAKQAGRPAASVQLVAVSKQQPDNHITAMLETGQTVFGENRVQEAQARWGLEGRFANHRENLELRLIGPLQSNKALAAVDLFDVIETLDRESLAKALVKAREKRGGLPRLLVQVNTGEEPQKAGIAPCDVPAFLERLDQVYDLHPEGLMCIPPQGEAASPHFWLLNNLARDSGLLILSMGMSADYEVAVAMGATHVRVGSALFGPRPNLSQ